MNASALIGYTLSVAGATVAVLVAIKALRQQRDFAAAFMIVAAFAMVVLGCQLLLTSDLKRVGCASVTAGGSERVTPERSAEGLIHDDQG